MDFGRALAIGLVTLYHIWGFLGSHSKPVGPVDLFGLASSGYVGVDLFYVISGYAMMLTWSRQQGPLFQRIGGFWMARFFRLYPAYFVAICIWELLQFSGVGPKPSGLYHV